MNRYLFPVICPAIRESFETNTQEVKRGKDSYNISEHLSERRGLPRAEWWLEKTAQQGYAPAQNSLAVMYAKEEGVEKDIQRAIKWLEKATKQGYAPAQFLLAQMYSTGEGVEKDIQRAIKWLEKATKQGYAPAQFLLAQMYSTGEGVEQDRRRAIKWLEKAAQKGHAPAKTILDKALKKKKEKKNTLSLKTCSNIF